MSFGKRTSRGDEPGMWGDARGSKKRGLDLWGRKEAGSLGGGRRICGTWENGQYEINWPFKQKEGEATL